MQLFKGPLKKFHVPSTWLEEKETGFMNRSYSVIGRNRVPRFWSICFPPSVVLSDRRRSSRSCCKAPCCRGVGRTSGRRAARSSSLSLPQKCPEGNLTARSPCLDAPGLIFQTKPAVVCQGVSSWRSRTVLKSLDLMPIQKLNLHSENAGGVT